MTTVEIHGDKFRVDGQPTNIGRTIHGIDVEGRLINSRMINGIFDDSTPQTQANWAYPDTKVWDAERNVTEFLAAMPSWVESGLNAITLGIQGGSPRGYSKEQPWNNAGFTPDGHLLPVYADRLGRCLSKADELGLVVIVDIFYFGQDQRLEGEDAVKLAVTETCEFVLNNGYRNVLIEIANECDIQYTHPIILAPRAHELVALAQSVEVDGRRLLTSTSFTMRKRPTPEVVAIADFVLLHGNGFTDPQQVTDLVDHVRNTEGYTPKPIVFNEDDHFDFDNPQNHMLTALRAGASWGYFDYGSGTPQDGFQGNYFDGYQSLPADWQANHPRKKAFFAAIQAP